MKTVKEDYYTENYDERFLARQQQLFHDGGFEKRIQFIHDFAAGYLNGHAVLDLGCGVGTFALDFAKRGCQTVGLDISPRSIQACVENQKKLNIENATFIKADIQENVFQPESFDSIIAADIIEHLNPILLRKALENCFMWLRKGGALVIHTFPTRYYYQVMTPASLALLPLMWMSSYNAERYVRFLHKTFFNMISLVVFRKTIHRYFATRGHCNPPHPKAFYNIVKNAGFTIKKYELFDLPLSVLRMNQPSFSFLKSIINKQDILKSSIGVVAVKPGDEVPDGVSHN